MRVTCGICYQESEQVDRAIGALEAENERLRALMEKELKVYQYGVSERVRLEKELEQAEARVRALEEACRQADVAVSAVHDLVTVLLDGAQIADAEGAHALVWRVHDILRPTTPAPGEGERG